MSQEELKPNTLSKEEIEGLIDVLDRQITIRKRKIEIMNRTIAKIQERIERIKAGEDVDKVMSD